MVKRFNKRLTWCIVAGLIAIHFSLGFLSLLQKSLTFDEPVFLAGGLYYNLKGNYRINPEGGILPQRLAAFGARLAGKVEFPSDKMLMVIVHDQQFKTHALPKLNTHYNKMVIWGRVTVLIFNSLVGGIIVFLIASNIWGRAGGLTSLAIYSLSPFVLANSRLMVVDLPVSIFFLLALWSCWRLFRNVTLLNFLLAVIGIAGVIMSKMSGIIIVPIFFVLFLVSLFFFRKVTVKLPGYKSTIRIFRKRIVMLSVTAFAGIFSVYFLIWAAYGFNSSLKNNLSCPRDVQLIDQSWDSVMDGNFARGELEVARKYHLLPESYIYGLAHILKTGKPRKSFLLGRKYSKGCWYYFPVGMSLKTPVPVMILLIIAIVYSVILGLSWKRSDKLSYKCKTISRYGICFFPFIFFGIVYFSIAVASGLNIGLRYIMPVYLCIILFCGIFGGLCLRLRYGSRVCFLLLCWFGVCSFMAYPNYLSYVNVSAGGRSNVRKLLADSSADWGQDLILLDRKLSDSRGENIYLACFSNLRPEFYVKKKFDYLLRQRRNGRLAGFYEERPGIYCISITYLWNLVGSDTPLKRKEFLEFYQLLLNKKYQYLSAKQSGKLLELLKGKGQEYWKNVMNLYDQFSYLNMCRYLRKRKPDDYAGGSIMIYKIGPEELKKISSGTWMNDTLQVPVDHPELAECSHQNEKVKYFVKTKKFGPWIRSLKSINSCSD